MQRDLSKPKRAQMSTNEPKQRPNKYNGVAGISINEHTNKWAQMCTNERERRPNEGQTSVTGQWGWA